MGSTSRYLAIWMCIFAVVLAHSAAFPKTKEPVKKLPKKALVDLIARRLRPSFVKREFQAPLLRAGEEKIDDEYIVKLKDDLTVEQLVEFEENLQKLCEERGLHIDFQINVTELMKGFVARIPGEAIHIVRWLDEVEFVEEDEVVHGSLPWGLDRIDQADLPLDNSYSPQLGDGSGVNVFVLDTGIRYSHTEFDDRARSFFDAFTDGRNGNDCQGHGTHCAGTIGGRTVGVAPGVTLYSGRVLNCRGSGSTSGVIAGMDAVARSNKKPGVVSMSLGGGFSSSMNLAVKRLTEAGYIVVVAAGNNAGDACQKSPASAPEAITVGATTSRDNLAGYSNFGRCVNILAPGSSVYSAYKGGDTDYRTLSGTSMATPHVAGVAALILAEASSLTQDQMKNALLEAAQSGKIDLSGVPSSHRSSTPNKLLHIPSETDGGNPTPPPTEEICENTCWFHHDGDCDDGGPGAHYSLCDFGSDCADCGVRRRPITTPECNGEWTRFFDRDNPDDSGDWESLSSLRRENPGEICDDPSAIYAESLSGTPAGSTGETFYAYDTERGFVCRNEDQSDGICLDYRVKFCQDQSQGLCENTCRYHGDGECDDGGPGSLYDVCAYGTDCEDCGPGQSFRPYMKHL